MVPPVGSLAAGKMSLPQIDQAAAAVTIPAKPGLGGWVVSHLSYWGLR